MVEFFEFINAGGLLDLSALGKLFTWYGSRSKGSCLDHFLVSGEWLDRFEGLEQRNLLRSVSDHDPVRLSCGEVNWGPHHFHFLNVWLEQKAHVKLMKDEWRRISDTDPLVSVVDKLRKLKVFLKQWNRVTFGSIDAQIEAATTLLNELDEKLDNMDENMVSMRRKVQGELWRLLRYRESIW
ncbi:hypothetical protein V6N13_019959 [Hibiscus sabdariffa]